MLSSLCPYLDIASISPGMTSEENRLAFSVHFSLIFCNLGIRSHIGYSPSIVSYPHSLCECHFNLIMHKNCNSWYLNNYTLPKCFLKVFCVHFLCFPQSGLWCLHSYWILHKKRKVSSHYLNSNGAFLSFLDDPIHWKGGFFFQAIVKGGDTGLPITCRTLSPSLQNAYSFKSGPSA